MDLNREQTILVVDDEADLCDILRYNLQMAGYMVRTANSAEEALGRGLDGIDLILLDVMMGEMSGFDLAARLKADPLTSRIPIIFLTARDGENDVLKGLGIGADDYISKPFSIREVTLRVKAVLRRSGQSLPAAPNNIERYKGICVDIDRKTVSVDGTDVPFTRTEFEILLLFIRKKGKVVSRAEMIQKVWPDDVLVMDRTVDVNITRVRKKISPYSSSIVTRSGFGYYLENE